MEPVDRAFRISAARPPNRRTGASKRKRKSGRNLARSLASGKHDVRRHARAPGLLLKGVLYAALIGLLGGLFPAIRAARLPVAAALREM